MAAWLFTTAKYLALLRDHSQLRSGGWGGWAGEKNLDEDNEGADSEEKGPETASRLSGTHSVVGASWAFKSEARGGRFPDVPTPGLSSSAGGGGHAWNDLSSISSSRSKPAGQIPPRAP